MEGVTVIDTTTFAKLIDSIEELRSKVLRQMEEQTDPYLTTKEVQKMLKKSENWVLLHKEELGFSKRTGTLLFKRKDIVEYINEDYYNRRKTN